MPKLIDLRVTLATSPEVTTGEARKRLEAVIRAAGVVAVLLPEGENPTDLVQAPSIWFDSADVRQGAETVARKPRGQKP